jgi:hypothetical protein
MYNRCHKYEIPLWMDEISGFSTDFGGGFRLAESLYLALKFGKITLWSFLSFLEMYDNYKTPNKLYYTNKQFYKFIRPGAIQIDSKSSSTQLQVIAFRDNANKRITVVILNGTKNDSYAKITLDNHFLNFNLYRTTFSTYDNCTDFGLIGDPVTNVPAQSITTYVWEGSNLPPTMAVQHDTTVMMNAPIQNIKLKGITAGGDIGQIVSVTAMSSKQDFIKNYSVSYHAPDSVAIFSFAPEPGKSGFSDISIILTDNGDTAGGFNKTIKKFRISVPGVGLQEANNEINVFPNPCINNLFIESPDEINSIALYSLTGELLLQKNQNDKKEIILDVDFIVNGIYILCITSKDGDLSRFKIVKE